MSPELRKQLEGAKRPLRKLEALQTEESKTENLNVKAYANRFLRLHAVVALTGMSRSSIYEKMNSNDFPRPVALGEKSVAWIEREVQAWMTSRIKTRDKRKRGSNEATTG